MSKGRKCSDIQATSIWSRYPFIIHIKNSSGQNWQFRERRWGKSWRIIYQSIQIIIHSFLRRRPWQLSRCYNIQRRAWKEYRFARNIVKVSRISLPFSLTFCLVPLGLCPCELDGRTRKTWKMTPFVVGISAEDTTERRKVISHLRSREWSAERAFFFLLHSGMSNGII